MRTGTRRAKKRESSAAKPGSSPAPSRASWWKIGLLLVLTFVLTILVFRHTTGLKGPWYGITMWRRLPAVYAYGWMGAAALPLVAAILLHEWRGQRIGALLLLPLLMVAVMAMKLVSAATTLDPPSLEFIPFIVSNPSATSYYADAGALNSAASVSEWLTMFPEVMFGLNLHSMTKPPGAIRYYTAFIKAMGYNERSAMAAGVTVGALATLSIPMTWLLVSTIQRSTRTSGEPAGAPSPDARRVAFYAATLLAICPGYVYFFPMGDPVFPVFAGALAVLWILAVEHNRFRYSLGMGCVLWLTTIATYNVLVVGFFLAMYPFVVSRGSLSQTLKTIVQHAGAAVATCALLYLLMYLTTGYDPVSTFEAAWRNQQWLLERHAGDRPYPDTIWNDLLEFALGTAWIGFALAVLRPITAGSAGFWSNRTNRVVVLVFAQLVVIAVTALLQSETARVWNFMYPFLLLPAGLELASYSRPQRLVACGCMLWMLLVLGQQIQFM